ncbi:Hypothetical protein A7982_04997 [Minicystis rosea]|nr:Hypothetical protein A7982_04997 [Minicystis rosea]
MIKALTWSAVVASVLAASPARADDPTLVGLFEGHGIAPPSEPVRARLAVAAAQRAKTLCSALYQQRGGGTSSSDGACGPLKVTLASLGRDAAAAILDVLDEPRRIGDRGVDTFVPMIDALAATGREDLVPVFIIALERLAVRSHLGDPRASYIGFRDVDAMNGALTRLTYLEPYEQRWPSGDDRIAPAVTGWRAFWEQNKHKTRTAWKAESQERARRRLASASGVEAEAPALALAQHADSKREGIAALKRLARSPACADRCPEARAFLHELEPRGLWLTNPR